MAILPIRMHPDPVLRERAPEVREIDASIIRLIVNMEDTMRDAPGIGLAAPQIGVQRRVIVYDIGEGLHALVNPEITSRRGEVVDDEGCLSLPGLSYEVARAEHITVRAQIAGGETVTYEASDLEARVIQHEIDHLDGVLFIDRIDRALRKEALRILRQRALAGAPVEKPAAPVL